jgi:hypothetical protein
MAITNPYKFFRTTRENVEVTGVIATGGPAGAIPLISERKLLSKRYDEPTYMTFRVLFGQNSATVSGTNLLNTDYDRMPHPLFINQQVDATQRSGQGGRNVVEFNRDQYSTRDYLRDANEFTRAEMLKEFITLWEDLQQNFQWYFQSIEGLDEILRVVPERGIRVSKEARLTFTMSEGIDQRISYLLNLYRKIAWDDTYQRWVLPDLMRFFDIQIYITEFRTFHQSSVSPNSNAPVYLQILNGILPTYLIECQMCEFDLNSFDFSYRAKASVNEDPEMTTVSFKVKVGNVNEISTYPLFSHFIMNDYKINGLDRSKEEGLVKDKDGRVINATSTASANELPVPQDYFSTKSGDIRYRNLDQKAQDTFFQQPHYSATPVNGNSTDNLKNSSPNYSIDVNTVDPVEPATWVGNAITFGKSFAVNFVTQKIDKAKMTNIPGLGFSFNDAVAAIQSKDFNSVLALIRRAIALSVGGTQPASSQLDNKIDNTFKEFLTGVAQSEATDGDELELAKSARLILSNAGAWEVVKDLSLATNLVAQGQGNVPVKIEAANQYKQFVAISTSNDRSKATDLDGGPVITKTGTLRGINTPSLATVTRELTGRKYVNVTDRSFATDLDGGPNFSKPIEIITAVPSSQLNKKIDSRGQNTTTIISESTNGDNVKGGAMTGDGGLGNIAKGDLKTTDEKSEATNSKNIKAGNLTGTGGLGSVVSGDLKTTSVKSEATDGDNIKGGDITGVGGLGSKISGGDFSGTGGLGSVIKGGDFTGVGGLGSSVDGGDFTGDGGLGTKIDNGGLNKTSIKSEATDGDLVKDKLIDQPNPSKATNN